MKNKNNLPQVITRSMSSPQIGLNNFINELDSLNDTRHDFASIQFKNLRLSLCEIDNLQSENKALREKLDRFITLSNGLSVYVRNEFNEAKLISDDQSILAMKIWDLYAHQCDCEQLTQTGGKGG